MVPTCEVPSVYTLDELVAESGYSRSMIRYFRKIRLLSPPEQRMGQVVWTDRHLRELRTTRRIRDNNRTYEDIVEYLHGENA